MSTLHYIIVKVDYYSLTLYEAPISLYIKSTYNSLDLENNEYPNMVYYPILVRWILYDPLLIDQGLGLINELLVSGNFTFMGSSKSIGEKALCGCRSHICWI